ncbi:hypothetical protein ACFORO_45160 [Amycolatopsis halotolerans]|uniref:Uncharacterized protein n=1 Tax=Amycolatopsis halotolerans TaxID=330083 RepID=A0ABV7QZ08_9PSEU
MYAEAAPRADGLPLQLVAGELAECGASVVVTDPAAAERVEWSTPQLGRVRIDPSPKVSSC